MPIYRVSDSWKGCVRATGLNGSLAQIVRKHRRELQITQEYLGLLAGVSERTIRDLEKGRESIAFDKVTAVLDTLGIDLIPRER